MNFDPTSLPPRDIYKFMIGAIVPRPIAWVSTQDSRGVVNLAPFSFFNGVTSRPPMISIAVGSRSWNGELVPKDTWRNAEDTGEFVAHLATVPFAALVNASAADFAPDESETEALGLETAPSVRVKPPRIVGPPVALECVVERIIPLGKPPNNALILGEIVWVHVEDSVWDAATQTVDVEKLEPIARLGGISWAELGRIRELPRPSVPHPSRRSPEEERPAGAQTPEAKK